MSQPDKMSSEQDLVIYTRPEIRKGSMWDIRLIFSTKFLEQHNLKHLHLEKPKIPKEDGAYLCIKVRSKLLKKELGFNKVADIENDKSYLTINDSGTTVLKVKFTQRPRSVFHKHADVMILVVSVRSSLTGTILTTSEHELIFRGGTGSVHSADSKKRQSSSKSEDESSENESYCPPKKKMVTDNNNCIKNDTHFNYGLNLLDQPFDYFGSTDELRESLQLEEWAKQYGIDPPLIENDMSKYIASQNEIFGFENCSPYQQENKITVNEHYNSMLRLKEEIREMIDQKIEQFSLALEEKLENQKKEIERIVNSSLLYSTQGLDSNKLMCSLKMK